MNFVVFTQFAKEVIRKSINGTIFYKFLIFINYLSECSDEHALKLACQALLEVVQSSSKNIELGMRFFYFELFNRKSQ